MATQAPMIPAPRFFPYTRRASLQPRSLRCRTGYHTSAACAAAVLNPLRRHVETGNAVRTATEGGAAGARGGARGDGGRGCSCRREAARDAGPGRAGGAAGAQRGGADAGLRPDVAALARASEAAIRVAPPPSPSLPVLEQLQAEVDRICSTPSTVRYLGDRDGVKAMQEAVAAAAVAAGEEQAAEIIALREKLSSAEAILGGEAPEGAAADAAGDDDGGRGGSSLPTGGTSSRRSSTPSRTRRRELRRRSRSRICGT